LIQSAVRTALDELTVLVAWPERGSRVLVLGPAGAREVFSLPPRPEERPMASPDANYFRDTPDSLAILPHGQLAVVRVHPGHELPSELEPALLLQPGQPERSLAPWSALLPASAPECQADRSGYRLVLRHAERGLWLLRWSETRLCVEAVAASVGETPPGRPWETTSVRFTASSTQAGKFYFASGSESRTRLRCALEPAR
jgi:hypothetical protein